MNYNLFGEPVKLPGESVNNTKIIKKENKPDQYESFGLEKNKTAYDRDNAPLKFCSWCLLDNHESGFSMCFVNWIICKPCIDKGLVDFQNNKAFKMENCMRCRKETNTFTSIGEGFQVGICLECLETGKLLLAGYDKNLNYKTGQYRIL